MSAPQKHYFFCEGIEIDLHDVAEPSNTTPCSQMPLSATFCKTLAHQIQTSCLVSPIFDSLPCDTTVINGYNLLPSPLLMSDTHYIQPAYAVTRNPVNSQKSSKYSWIIQIKYDPSI